MKCIFFHSSEPIFNEILNIHGPKHTFNQDNKTIKIRSSKNKLIKKTIVQNNSPCDMLKDQKYHVVSYTEAVGGLIMKLCLIYFQMINSKIFLEMRR